MCLVIMWSCVGGQVTRSAGEIQILTKTLLSFPEYEWLWFCVAYWKLWLAAFFVLQYEGDRSRVTKGPGPCGASRPPSWPGAPPGSLPLRPSSRLRRGPTSPVSMCWTLHQEVCNVGSNKVNVFKPVPVYILMEQKPAFTHAPWARWFGVFGMQCQLLRLLL